MCERLALCKYKNYADQILIGNMVWNLVTLIKVNMLLKIIGHIIHSLFWMF